MTIVSLEGQSHSQSATVRTESHAQYNTHHQRSNGHGTNGRYSASSVSDHEYSIEEGSAVSKGTNGAHNGPAGTEGSKLGGAEEEAHYSPPSSPPTLTVQQQLEEIWQTVQLRAVWRPMVGDRAAAAAPVLRSPSPIALMHLPWPYLSAFPRPSFHSYPSCFLPACPHLPCLSYSFLG